MSGDIVYADLQIVRTSPLECSSPVPRSDCRHHGILLKIGCTMIIVLLVIIIILSIFVIQYNCARHTEVDNESKEAYCDGKNKSGTITSIVVGFLREKLKIQFCKDYLQFPLQEDNGELMIWMTCDPFEDPRLMKEYPNLTASPSISSNSSTAHKPCPNKDWNLHGGKCYWVATHKKSWIESRNDCAMKNSQLMVIRDFTDMSFLWLHLNHSGYYWIGLSIIPTTDKQWTWVDNSSFDPHLFSIKESTPQTRSMKCAQVSRINVIGKKCEDCEQWICQL